MDHPSLSVLLIDPDSQDRERYRCLLSEGSNPPWSFWEAASPEEALKQCLHARPGCILLASSLADSKAGGWLRTLRGSSDHQLVPLILLGEAGDQEAASTALNLGAHAYLFKHLLEQGMLRLVVQQALKSHSMARRLQAYQAHASISHELGQTAILQEAIPRSLAVIGKALQWRQVIWWQADLATQQLRCLATWTSGSAGAEDGTPATSRLLRFQQGLPGRVWSNGKAIWRTEIQSESSFTSSSPATGNRSALAFPIKIGARTIAVIECWSRETGQPDEECRQAISALGNQIGQFVERKQTEEKFRLVVESTPNAILMIDASARMTFANLQAEKLFGYLREELIGRPVEILLSRNQRSPDAAPFFNSGESFDNSRMEEAYGLKNDGRQFPIELCHRPIEVEEGRLLLVSIRDITQHRRSQQALQLAREELEVRVQQRTADLAKAIVALQVEVAEHKRAKQALRQAHDDLELRVKERTAELVKINSELQSFATVASHDLQEPLRKVQTFGDLLRVELGSSLSPKAGEYLARMQNAAARMQTLIEDLLAFSRVTTKAQPFDEVRLQAVIEEVLSDLEVRLRDSKGTVQVAELPKIEADPTQMRQLFQNLIANALKFHRREASPEVKVSGEVLSDGEDRRGALLAKITVQDNGIGFSERYLDRIFTVFQRLHGRSEYEGTGMGLAICRKIVERHGGHITASSIPGQGSIFSVTLPVEQPKGAMVQ